MRGLIGRVPYAGWAAAFALFSCFLSNFGLDAILALSVPLLNALYPVSIVLVIMGMAHKVCDRVPLVWPWVAGVTAVISVATAVRDALAPALQTPLDLLPFADIGLGWLVPAAVAAAIGVAMSRRAAR